VLFVETMSNPLLRVADLRQLSQLAQENECLLVVDNTFATPVLVRPLELGADLVMESLTKMISGHADVTLGVVCGGDDYHAEVNDAASVWGLASNPFDCWLASRGLATLPLRMRAASAHAAGDHCGSYAQRRSRGYPREEAAVHTIDSDSDELARRLNLEAAKAVKYGNVPPADALAFITSHGATLGDALLSPTDLCGLRAATPGGVWILGYRAHPSVLVAMCTPAMVVLPIRSQSASGLTALLAMA